MVDLPTIENTVPQVHAPQSRVSAGQISEPFTQLAENLNKAGEVLNKDIAQPLAKIAGQAAVTRDADGNVQVERWPIVGDAATVYARAMKIEATTQGEAEARQRNIELRQKHLDDPEAYRTAAKAFKNEFLKTFKAAGPEVQTALGHSFDSLSIETYNGLLNQKQHRDLTRATNGIQAEIETTKNEMTALANGGDTASPDFQRRASKIKALYGELVGNQLLAYPQAKADQEIKQFDSEMRSNALAYEVGHSVWDKAEEEKPGSGPEVALKAAEMIRTDPKLNLSAGQREAYYNRAVGGINQRINTEARSAKAIATEIGDIEKIASEGYKPTDKRMADLKTMVDETKDPAMLARYQATLANLPIVADWKRMAPGQLEQQLNRLNQQMREGGASAQGLALLDTGQKLLKTMNKELANDPLGWANRTGALAVSPIDFAGPTAGADMRGRVATADIVARQYGIAPTYLTPEERRFLEVTSAKGGNEMLGMAQAISAGFGDRAQNVLAEVSKEAPILSHMGGLLTGSLFGGGSTTFANDVAEAVQLRQNKEFKLPRWLDHPSDKILIAQTAKTISEYGDAFTLVSNNGRAAEASAQAAYFARANRQGLSALVDDSKSEKTYRTALQEAAGATTDAKGVQYGGIATVKPGGWTNYKVIVPGSIRTDRFTDVIGAVKDEDLARLPISPKSGDKAYTAADLRSAVPVAVPGGYRFAQGEPASDDPKWVRGADGKPFVLNLDALEPVLRPRVPGAYNGAR